MKKFNYIFFGVILTTFLVLIASYFNSQRPKVRESKSLAEQIQYVKATGKCIECHRAETSSIVHQFEMSNHAKAGLNCFDCHRSQDGQKTMNHKGFQIVSQVTSKNCASCHATEYEQFRRSRHGASAWAAVRGHQDFSPEQLAFGEKYHPGMVKREANQLALLENQGAIAKGCQGCHSIGRPNADGSLGSCTQCHGTHNPSIEMARRPESCAQCHMGPDHSQFEIYSESKHGAVYVAHQDKINFSADPKSLTTQDFFVPTCATCHFSGLEGMKVTHDTTERLSLLLYAPITHKRSNFRAGRDQMQEVCLKCHAGGRIEEFYRLGDVVVEATNQTILEAQKIMAGLRKKGLITKEPFDEEIEFLMFDLWHYDGRTAKHGAFMGGSDFVQWHGNYELFLKMTQLKEMAKNLEKNHRK